MPAIFSTIFLAILPIFPCHLPCHPSNNSLYFLAPDFPPIPPDLFILSSRQIARCLSGWCHTIATTIQLYWTRQNSQQQKLMQQKSKQQLRHFPDFSTLRGPVKERQRAMTVRSRLPGRIQSAQKAYFLPTVESQRFWHTFLRQMASATSRDSTPRRKPSGTS